MKILTKIILIAMAAMMVPIDEAEAHPVCESRSVWIPAAQSSYGYWRSGYWTTIQQCHNPPHPLPPVAIVAPPVRVVAPPVTVQIRPRTPILRPHTHGHSHHHRRPSPRPPARR